MSSATPTAGSGTGTPQAAATTTSTTVDYDLIGNYTTVEVLSATQTAPIEYCTIQTTPSSVVASIPVQKPVFDAGQAGVQLMNFAQAIEQTMGLATVTGAVGTQQIDDNGLLKDYVAFTVGYTAGGAPSGAVTTEVLIPVGELDFTDAEIGRFLWAKVQAEIAKAYGNLKAAAGG